MRTRTAAMAMAVMLAGCNSQPSEQQPSKPIVVRGAEQEKLHQLNGLNRSIALKRAIYDSGYRCQRIARSGFVGLYKNLDMWMASCADGRDWAVFIGPDGSAQVRDCKDVKGFGLPECRINGEEASGAGKLGE